MPIFLPDSIYTVSFGSHICNVMINNVELCLFKVQPQRDTTLEIITVTLYITFRELVTEKNI